MTDYNEARRFLQLLDPDATAFTFQTFDDSPRKDSALARVRHGSLEELWPELVQLGEMGAGIFVTVNETDGSGRKAENSTRKRANWIDADDAKAVPATPLEPSIGVRTSPGKGHLYFLTADNGMTNEQHRGIQERLIADYGSDPNAKDVVRVLRLPGTYHRKDPSNPHLVRLVPELSSGARYTTAQLMEAFPPPMVEAPSAEPGDPEPVDPARVRAALKHIPSDDRKVWLGTGMALKHALGENGFELWREWSAASHKYDVDDQRKTWASLKRTDAHGKVITIRSVFKLARQKGWDGKAYDGSKAGTGKKRSAADHLIEIAGAAELYHDADGTGFADVIVDSHRETWPVASRGFKSWLRHAYYGKTGNAPTSEAMQAAMGVIEARCQFDGEERHTYLRVAAHDGRYYVDLCDAGWRAIGVDADGWRIVDQPPVRFRRTAGMLALPEPQRGGKVDELRPFLNVSDSGFELCASWALTTLRGEGQRPILALNGEQGTAKTTMAAMLRSLTDPSTAPLRALPRTLWDLYVAAMNAHVLVFDNLSTLPPDVSDALCRLSTGGGFSARQLYSDDSEVRFNGQRAVILTGIEDLATRPDLVERILMPTLKSIPEDKRRADRELWGAFNAAAPRILGALLDVVAHGLLVQPHMKLDRLPRMADFALWMTAFETAIWPTGTFMRAYADDLTDAMVKALDAEPAIVVLRNFVHENPMWDGTAEGLWNILGNQAGPRQRRWPATPRALSGLLNRYAPALAKIGIFIDRSRTNAERSLCIVNARRYMQ